jgi:hypothetical protein
MTAEQKAHSLVNQFMLMPPTKLSDYSKIYMPTAKICALKVVDEVLETCSIGDTYEFYEKVKEHIEGI